jgi:beta-glucanase (GH16 family)
MKNFLIGAMVFSTSLLFGQSPGNDPHWQLVWQDEFDSFNSSIWQKENDSDHYGEPQMYRNQNVTTSNGNLVITANRENYLNHAFTSGMVYSKQAYNVQYGYIESKIKLPYAYGFWPAFWTFVGEGVTGGNAAEIDIFEMLGHLSPTIMTTSLHMSYPDGNPYYKELEPYGFNYNNTWHIYGVEWSPSKIVWYVDGVVVRTFDNPGISNPVRIVLNLAIEPDYLPNASAPFPSSMLVDFVKVYKLKNDCNTVINTCNYNFSTYDNKVKKEITIGGNGCSNTTPANTSLIMRASDGILLNGDFNVPVGSDIYFDASACY